MMATWWAKVIVVALAVALVLGAGYAVEKVWSDAITEASDKADKAGFDRATTAFAKRDNEQLQAALKKIEELEADRRAKEELAEKELAAAREVHAKEVADEQAKSLALAAAVRSGARRLRDAQGRCSASTTAGGESGTATAPAAPGGGDGGSGCELSGGTAANLSGLAARADRVRANLRLCQATVTTYLKECK